MARNPEQLKRIARELLTHPEQSYTEIAEKVGIDTSQPRNNLYQTLQSEGFKKIMAEIQKEIYDEDYLKRKVTAAIEETKPKDSVHGKYLELGMRNLAMLTDKTINENRNYDAAELERIRQKALKAAEVELNSVLAGTEKQPGTEIEPKTEPEPEIKG